MGSIGNSGRIFVIEDDESLAQGLKPVILPFGEAVLAYNTTEALRRIDTESERPIALVADICLPDGSGVEVVTHVRAQWPDVPALLITGFNGDEVVNAAFDLRADLICKPVERARLRRFLLDAACFARQAGLPARIRHVVDQERRRCSLSEAEAELLERGALGESSDQIAQSRGVSAETIKKQRASLLRKTGDVSFERARERVRHQAGQVR